MTCNCVGLSLESDDVKWADSCQEVCHPVISVGLKPLTNYLEKTGLVSLRKAVFHMLVSLQKVKLQAISEMVLPCFRTDFDMTAINYSGTS